MEEFMLEPGEKVMRVVRKHWFVLFLSFMPFLFFALIPVVLPIFLSHLVPHASPVFPYLTLDNRWYRLLTGIWWLLLWIGAFNAFTQYYLNHWTITSLRIVRIRQYAFFSREVSSFLLSHVQDVSTTVDGVLADLIGYGTVQVETAGTASKHFVMDGIDDPQGMRDLIMREIAELYKRPGNGLPHTGL